MALKRRAVNGGNAPDRRRNRVANQTRVNGRFAANVPVTQTPFLGTPPVLPPTGNKIINYVGWLVDVSGSMVGWRNNAEDAVNAQIQATLRETKSRGQELFIQVGVFDYRYQHVYEGPAEGYVYRTPSGGGMTALLRSTSDAIYALEKFDRYAGSQEDRSFLLYIITDGEENQGGNANTTAALMQTKIATDRWTFGFAVPPNGTRAIQALGIDKGNIMEWETSKRGFETLGTKISAASTMYASARGAGATQVKAGLFQVDLGAGLKAGSQKWESLSDRFKSWEVEKETDIASFLTTKLGSFSKGRGFYELTKKELVQSHKGLVVQDKDTGLVLTGDSAKTAIGLPVGLDHKIDPHNVGKFRIFVQSTSDNRKLVRGTRLLATK